MSKISQQWFYLTEGQLLRLVGQGTYPGAESAWEEVRKIKEAGQTPSIYYSKFNDFRIINESDPKQIMIGLSIRSHAKPFPM